jgi:hypothetical protein
MKQPPDGALIASGYPHLGRRAQALQGRVFAGRHVAQVRHGVKGHAGGAESGEYVAPDLFGHHIGIGTITE